MSHVLVFFNQMLSPILASGGDVLSAEVIKRWRGLKVAIIGPRTAEFLKEELKADCFYPLPETIIDRWYQKNKSVYKIALLYLLRGINAVRLARDFHPQTIYTTGDFICNTLPAFMLKKKNPQAKWLANIFHLNLPPAKRGKNRFLFALGSFWLQRISFALLKKADLIFLLNHSIKKSLIQLGFRPDRLVVIGAGINLAKINQVKLNQSRIEKVFFLGRLNLTKGIFDLPRIWSLVLKEVPKAKLILIGSGEEKTIASLQAEFAQADLLKRVSFRGFVEKSEAVYRMMKQGKVFVLPSYEEGWGMVVFEAIACGLAPVVYDLPVFKEIFNKSIKRVPLGDTVLFAKTVVRFLNREKLRRSYVFQLQRIIQRYDWDKIARKELDLMKKMGQKKEGA